MANKTSIEKTASDKAKKSGGEKAQYIRQAALKWLELQKPSVLAKIKELADQKFGASAKPKPAFVIDHELASMK